jgi:hypothetical protein
MLNSNQMFPKKPQSCTTTSDMITQLRNSSSTNSLASRQEEIERLDQEIARIQTPEGREALESVGVNPREFLALLRETRDYLLS